MENICLYIARVYLDPSSLSSFACINRSASNGSLWRDKFIHDFGESVYKVARSLRSSASDKELYTRHLNGDYGVYDFYPMFNELGLVKGLKKGDVVKKGQIPMRSNADGVVSEIIRCGHWVRVRLTYVII